SFVFYFILTAPTGIYSLSLHDALPILLLNNHCQFVLFFYCFFINVFFCNCGQLTISFLFFIQSLLQQISNILLSHSLCQGYQSADRKSTRLNSSHVKISYAVFCLKKKT